MKSARYFTPIVVALAALLAIGCSDSLAPYSPEITNVPDNFQFQITGARNVTVVREYVWQNSGTTANVDQASAITSGSAILTILDSQATQMYTNNLSVGGSTSTSTGVTGAWRIRVTFTNLYGTINFRVQRP